MTVEDAPVDQLADLAAEVKRINTLNGWHDVNIKVGMFLDRVSEEMNVSAAQFQAMRAIAIEHFGPRTFGDDIALLHSEVSEMLEEYRSIGLKSLVEWKTPQGDVEVVELGSPRDLARRRAAERQREAGMPFDKGKPLGVASEAADVLIRLLDTCGRYNINLLEETTRKLAYNEMRGWKHGGKAM